MFNGDFSHYDFQVRLLLVLIVTFIVAFALFFILTYIKRYKRIKKNELKVVYQKKIDELLFALLFDNETSVEIASDNFNTIIIPTKLIKKITIKSINALHRNYTGELKQKLELFYIESGLVNYSLKKIDSLNWAKVVEAIRDLSNLNYQPAYETIVTKLDHPKKIVQKEAFIGVILLKGFDGLVYFRNTDIYIDDWTQSNILYVAKRDKMNAPEDIGLVLESKNESIVLLGARIIQYFQLWQCIPNLEKWTEFNPDSKASKKINDIITQLKNTH